MSDAGFELILRGSRVREDSTGAICLNDLWKLVGSPDNQRARDWYRSKRVLALEATLQERIVGNSHKSSKEVKGSTYYARGRGTGALTFAHPVLALDYAQYLDPKLAIEVNELFLKYKADAVSLAIEILEGMDEQADYDATRVQLRQLVKEHNKLSAGAAKGAGVTNFEAYNGAGLRGLYGGMTKAELLRYKRLLEGSIRRHTICTPISNRISKGWDVCRISMAMASTRMGPLVNTRVCLLRCGGRPRNTHRPLNAVPLFRLTLPLSM